MIIPRVRKFALPGGSKPRGKPLLRVKGLDSQEVSWDSIWGARCLWGINTCKRKRRKQDWAEANWTEMQVLQSLGQPSRELWSRYCLSEGLGLYAHPSFSLGMQAAPPARVWPQAMWLLQMREILKVTARGYYTTTLLIDEQQILPWRGT